MWIGAARADTTLMDTEPSTDARALVIAPVSHALTRLVVRGLALVGALGLLAVWMVAAKPGPAGRDAATFLAISLLATYSLIVRGRRIVRGRPSLEERAVAWERAQELDRDETALAMLVVVWVPAAVCLALAVLMSPHLTAPDPRTSSPWAMIGVAAAGMAWMVMVATWLESARDDLARAEHEADLRFRSYWANIGR
jgi:hypothetical protein